jgi:hypothetical protein
MSKQEGRRGSKTLRVAGRGRIFKHRFVSNYPPETGHNSTSGCQPNRGNSKTVALWYPIPTRQALQPSTDSVIGASQHLRNIMVPLSMIV